MINCTRKLKPEEISTIERALCTGQLVEIMPMRDGSLKVKTVRKTEITTPLG
ncbi:MAG: hypothetical protein IJM21_09595 [Clostridia bacterium]|nr:hypothetical protein [Clostridia bacterium]